MVKLQILMPMAFGAFALGAFGAVDFITRKAAGGPDYGIGSYVSEVAGRIQFRTDTTRELLVQDMFPPAPGGWDMHEFVAEDLTRITGKPNEQQQKKVSALQVLGGSAMLMASVDKGEYRTYTRGAQTILFKITYIKSSALTGIGGDAIEAMLTVGQFTEDAQPAFATVRGLRFVEEKGKAYGVARRITARLGVQIELTLITLEDDETILRLLEGLDVAGLNRMLLDPIAGMGEGEVALAPRPGTAPQQDAAGTSGSDKLAAAEDGATAPRKSFFGSLFGGGKTAPAPARAEPVKIECAIEQGAKRCKIGG